RARIDRDVFPYRVAIADGQCRRLARILFILRNTADGAESVKRVVTANSCMAVNNTMRAHFAAGPSSDVLSQNAVGTDADIVSQGSRRINDCGGVDQITHAPSSNGRMAHMSLASATTCPSTLAEAEYLHMTRLMRSATTSRRSWSPGTTGWRNRA